MVAAIMTARLKPRIKLRRREQHAAPNSPGITFGKNVKYVENVQAHSAA